MQQSTCGFAAQRETEAQGLRLRARLRLRQVRRLRCRARSPIRVSAADFDKLPALQSSIADALQESAHCMGHLDGASWRRQKRQLSLGNHRCQLPKGLWRYWRAAAVLMKQNEVLRLVRNLSGGAEATNLLEASQNHV